MPEPIYAIFSHPIGAPSLQALQRACERYVENGYDPVYLLFTTTGGQMSEGITMYNLLRGMPFKLIMHNVGNVDSVGNAVFLAGIERYAVPTATFMFHGVGWNIPGATRLEEKNILEILDTIRASQKRMSSIIVDQTGITEKHVRQLFLEQATKDAVWAKDNRIVHDIRPVQIPKGATVRNIDLPRG